MVLGRWGGAVNVNLILAILWAMGGLYCLVFVPADFVTPGLLPVSRNMLIMIAAVLVVYNLSRWRFMRIRRRIDEETDAIPSPIRERGAKQPPNPDFDFSDPMPGDGPREPSNPRPPSSS